jgi:hypothetical protein
VGTDWDETNAARWEAWWADNGETFRIPLVKPYATWVPRYPLLADDHVARMRSMFAERGDGRSVEYELLSRVSGPCEFSVPIPRRLAGTRRPEEDEPVSPGIWVCYGCLDWGPALFHPADSHLKERMLAAGCVCQVETSEGDFWVFGFGELRFRVREELVGGGPVPRPAFEWGDVVRVTAPRTERVGVIRSIGWHADRHLHLFWIEQDGRRVRNRYFAEELEVHPGPPAATVLESS